MISMSKRNIILISVLLLVYIIVLVAFHATYEYTTYWEEETPIILRYSLLYIVIGLIIYFVFNRKAINRNVLSNVSIKGATKIMHLSSNRKTINRNILSNVTIKSATKIVAYASAIKAFLCICLFFIYLFSDYYLPLVHAAAWIAISAFFFTLYKNMK
jgi:hypothetical protein